MRNLSIAEVGEISGGVTLGGIAEGGLAGFGVGATIGAIGGPGFAVIGGLVGSLIGGAIAIKCDA